MRLTPRPARPAPGLLPALLRLLGLLTFLATQPAAATTAAAPLPAAVSEHLPRPHLLGQGRFRWLGLHIYDAALWIDQDGPHAASALPEQLAAGHRPLALHLRYARAFEGRDIARHSADEMARLGLADANQRARWLTVMLKLFPDVGPGSELIGVHLPGHGARFYTRDRLLGEVADAAFTRAFFALWLDPRTRAPALRDALLGRSDANHKGARP